MRAPAKVEAQALERGAHPACIEAGPDDACAGCHDIVMAAFDTFYGDVDLDRLRTRIAADVAAEGSLR